MLPSTIIYHGDDESTTMMEWARASLIYCNHSPRKYKILKNRYSNHPRGSIVNQKNLDKLIKIAWDNNSEFELWKAIRDNQ